MLRIKLLLPLLLLTPILLAAEKDPILIGGKFEIEAHRDIAYYEGKDADPKKHKLDLFLPKGQKDFPVLFFIHGGAWSTGDRWMYTAVGNTFAKNGIGTVVISYRLSPAVQHPAHIEDVARAFAWTHKNIGKYGGRADQIFVSGQSAGGHLAALLATSDMYLKAVNLTPKDIKAVIPISGVYLFPPGWFERVIGKGEAAINSASPLKQVTGREPPFFILYAQHDFQTCDAMSLNLCKALKEKKVAAEIQEIANRNHITIMLYLMLNEADPATQAMLQYIAKQSGMKLVPRGE